MEGDEKRKISDGLQYIPLSECVLHHLPLLHNGGLLQNLHSKQLPFLPIIDLSDKEDLPIP